MKRVSLYKKNYLLIFILNQNVSAQTLTLSMYFGVSWIEPRLLINDSAVEWTEIKTGPPDEINVSPETLQHIW